ncbi:hypothetical protein LJC15_01140 [Desulfovibrio sp. OttesenSCG-928-G11]|nr:hypothetical protein [Desulfovibrio sp. OttesenSCG-928-G11]
MSSRKKSTIAEVEKAAHELMALMTGICESQVSPKKEPPPKHKALAACTVAVQNAVKTFVAILRM